MGLKKGTTRNYTILEESMLLLPQVVYDRAREIYGNPLPQYIDEHIQKELDCIIGNGDFSYVFIAWREALRMSGFEVNQFKPDSNTASSLVCYLCGISNQEPQCVKAKEFSKERDEAIKSFLGIEGQKKPVISLNVLSKTNGEKIQEAAKAIPGMGTRVLPMYVREFGYEDEFAEIIKNNEDGNRIYDLTDFIEKMNVIY